MWRRVSITILALGCILPAAFLTLLSCARGWTFPRLLPPRLTALHWAEVFTGTSGLGSSLMLSAAIAFTVALFSTACGFLTSRAIARHPRRAFFVLLAHFPFAMSPVILGTCLLYLFIRLQLAGTMTGVVLAQFIFACAYSTILFQGFWNPQVLALEQLVYTLGGTPRQMATRMLLPVARPLLLVGFFQTFLYSWFDYGITLVIGAGRLPTLTLKIFEYAGSANFYLASACATLLMGPPLVMLIANRRLLLRGRI